ncbi:MAG: ABC-F family ATP-binding cassette domain-containing protein [Lachnospiraceae bacterium]|nr:ABC-F family ATP-binding cassette domain-containing protein [Lachnospiraceae bacterium]
MLLSCSRLGISFNGETVLSDCTFRIEKGEKCALVGINGAGKTTLLNLITGELAPETGSVFLSGDAHIGYLKQQNALSGGLSVLDEMLNAREDLLETEAELERMNSEMNSLSGQALDKSIERFTKLTSWFESEDGYAFRGRAAGILKGLGFPEEAFSTPTDRLSGGQKTRLALGKLLIGKADLIILDEPTNHLDLASVEWLEGFLKSFPGAVLVVSHDRYFLDRIVTKVFELERTRLSAFSGNYTAFSEKKKALRDAERKAWLNQRAEIRHSEEVIERLKSFNREKSVRRAESREKQLAKINRLERPEDLKDAMRLTITPRITSGNDVLSVEHLSKSFPEHPLFSDASFEIKRGERVALIGNNGTGKTTLLKILNRLETADTGSVTLGVNVRIGYYDQEHAVLNPANTIFEELSDACPELTNTEIRNTLAAFLFTGEEVFKEIRVLSGGERGRVSLAKLMLTNANFLILDEPTNHLDMTSKDILSEALNDYTGTVLFVSHDRYFVNSTATRILDLTAGRFINYLGNYDYYLEKRDDLSKRFTGSSSDTGSFNAAVKNRADSDGASSGKADWQDYKKKANAEKKRENELKKCEKEIDALETRLSEIDILLSDEEIARDITRLTELTGEQGSLNLRLEELMEEWERLQE